MYNVTWGYVRAFVSWIVHLVCITLILIILGTCFLRNNVQTNLHSLHTFTYVLIYCTNMHRIKTAFKQKTVSYSNTKVKHLRKMLNLYIRLQITLYLYFCHHYSACKSHKCGAILYLDKHHFLYLFREGRDIIINIRRYSCQTSVIFVQGFFYQT